MRRARSCRNSKSIWLCLEDIIQAHLGIIDLRREAPVAGDLVGNFTVLHVQERAALSLAHQAMTPVITRHRQLGRFVLGKFRF